MARKNRTPEENARREKIRELLQMENIGSMDGRKDVLGMWVGENESAKFWATVLNGLKNRGVEDIFIACTDNLAGFDAAIHATFPQTEIQNCIIHQLRNSSKYVAYRTRRSLWPT